MPRWVSQQKYTTQQNSEYNFRVLEVLVNSPEAITIDDIKSRDIVLSQVTNAKIAKVLGHLADMDLVVKTKSDKLNRMVYKSKDIMREQGYDI